MDGLTSQELPSSR